MCDSDGEKGKRVIRGQRRFRLRVKPSPVISGRIGNMTGAREASERQLDGRRGEAGVPRSLFCLGHL